MTEKEWQEQVEQLAAICHWKKYHTRNSKGSEEGFPDLVLLRKNRLMVVELKVGNAVPTDDQEVWLTAFKEAGIETHVWYPQDLEEVNKVLR